MKDNLKFVDSLSIHGIRHIFSGNKFKKVFWILAITGSIGFLCFYNFQLYIKLNQTPDINVRVRQKFITEIPFPALTVCTPLFATNRLASFYNISKYFRIGKIDLTLTVKQQNYLASNIHTCSPEHAVLVQNSVLNRTRNDIVNLLNESFLKLTEALMNCGYKKSRNDCTNIFYRVLTDRGFCYSYNLQGFETIFNEKVISEDFSSYKKYKILNSMNGNSIEKIEPINETIQWTLDKGYIDSNKSDLLPEKIIKGSIFGLNVFINTTDPSNICSLMGNVFSYYVHLPNEIMLPFHKENYVEIKRRKEIILTAKSYTADDSMRKFSPRSRGCYFENEKQLKYFKTYTKALCEFECMTNYTLKNCGCVKFSMPRASLTPVCTVDESDCYFEAMSIWPDHKAYNDRFDATCGCLKTCNNIVYETKFEKTSASDNIMTVFEMLNLSKEINMIFDDFEIVEYEEYASYKLHNFVADVGGLLGCSILSLIEIAYFLLEIFIRYLRNYLRKQPIGDDIKNFGNIKTGKSVNEIVVKPSAKTIQSSNNS